MNNLLYFCLIKLWHLSYFRIIIKYGFKCYSFLEHMPIYVWDSKTISGIWQGSVNCKAMSGTLHFTFDKGCKTVPGVRLSRRVDGNIKVLTQCWSHLSRRMHTRILDLRYTSRSISIYIVWRCSQVCLTVLNFYCENLISDDEFRITSTVWMLKK